ncbi:hypothetical protein PHMEG_00035806 [Phytophthora megakarya]|uniref:Ubiquitin-like protease family profile domain-containing protein n=1 Tax=Phytophthora megakarya TaxID=4795 RepID=A0A225UN75_9STRA|nr:hypothetical protein PHMEG_00035806 [Phytophthora megakarya]
MTEKLHYSSKLVRFHTNWKAFEGYLTSYQHDTSTVMVVSETLNVRLRNARIKDMKIHEGKALSELPLVPDTMDPYQPVYICTHGWKLRNRSTGQRPTHRINYTGCEDSKDSNNCGLFVCLFFWRRVYKEAGSDYSELGLLHRRWDVLCGMVTASDNANVDDNEKVSPKTES